MLAKSALQSGVNYMTASVHEVVDEYAVFKEELNTFISSVLNPSGGVSKPDMFPLVYLQEALPGYQSGGALWGLVSEGDEHYYVGKQEGNIFRKHSSYMQQLFYANPQGRLEHERPAVYELGPGDLFTLSQKTMRIVSDVHASHYVAVDVNPIFAEQAASHVRIQNRDMVTQYVWADYTKPHKIDNVFVRNSEATSLGLFLGCAATQHRFLNKNPGQVSFREVLSNFGEMLGRNTLLVVTVDTNTTPSSAENCYSGADVKAFLGNWLQSVAARLATDADPENNYVRINGKPLTDPKSLAVLKEAIVVSSLYESSSSHKGGRVVHSLHVGKPIITITINGVEREIPPGTRIEIGSSEKWPLSTVKNEIKKSGEWTTVRTLDAGGSVQALVLAGADVPKAQMDRARRPTGSAPMIVSSVVSARGDDRVAKSVLQPGVLMLAGAGGSTVSGLFL